MSREEALQALNEMKTGKALGLSKVLLVVVLVVVLELIAASGGVKIQVIAEICQSPRWILNAS